MAACGTNTASDNEVTGGVTQREAVDAAVDYIRGRAAHGTWWSDPMNLDAVIADVDAGTHPNIRAVVKGHFRSAEQGYGYDPTDYELDPDTPDGREVPFDDPGADWRTAFATFTVSEVIAGDEAREELVFEFGVLADSSLKEIFDVHVDPVAGLEAALTELGEVVVFASRDPAFPESSEADYVAAASRSMIFRYTGVGWEAPFAPLHAAVHDEPLQSRSLAEHA